MVTDVIDRILDIIKKHNLIENGESVIVGVSGGPDSVCLLHALHSLTQELNIKIFASHINHMLRGEESEGDERYVRELCERLGITLHTKSFDIKKISRDKGLSLEETGREVRYHQFALLADHVGAKKIAVAHNKNDQAETVLMRIIRGTGLDGLKGMEHTRGKIIRPLLDISRCDIEKYCGEHSLNPRIDSSNQQSVYTRNRVRLKLIPYIDKLFETDLVESVFKMSTLLREDNDFIEESTVSLYNQCILKKQKNEIVLDILKIEHHHRAVKKRIMRNALKELKGDLKGIESIHIEDIIDLSLNGRTGAEVHLPCNVRAAKSYSTLRIFIHCEEARVPCFNKTISIPGVTSVKALGVQVEVSIEENRGCMEKYANEESDSLIQFFDYERLKGGIDIRNRKEGDIFKPLKSNGTKKLKEYLIDNKVPRNLRDEIPLIAKDNEVVWIVGYKTSDKFKVTENTKSVLKLEYNKEWGKG